MWCMSTEVPKYGYSECEFVEAPPQAIQIGRIGEFYIQLKAEEDDLQEVSHTLNELAIYAGPSARTVGAV